MSKENAGYNPYDKKIGEGDLSVEAIDFILSKDIEHFDSSQVVNPERPGSVKKKQEPSGEDKGSEWRIAV